VWSAEKRAEGLEYIHPKPSSHSGRIVGNSEAMLKVPVNALTGQVGTRSNLSGYRTNRELAARQIGRSRWTRGRDCVRTSLKWYTNPALQIGKARVTSQRVESGIHPDEGHSIRTGEIGFLEPGEGLLVLSQSGVYASYIKPTDVPLPRLCLDPS
jgi:hypothetical protein